MVSPLGSEDFLRVLKRAKKEDDLGTRIANALELIQGALDELDEQAVALSFNGGKDCTVLLHLFAVALYARHATVPSELRIRRVPVEIPTIAQSATTESIPEVHGTTTETSESGAGAQTKAHQLESGASLYPPVKSIYITAPNHFPELDDFTDDSVTRYGMDLYRFGGNMKAALTEYLSCGGGRGVRGILVGTRTGDPNGRKFTHPGQEPSDKAGVKPIDPTDPHWPQFLRIHPILDWTYSQIWAFLRELDVPYCHLYDEGYTSLGSTKNTVPNPLLRKDDGTYEPAWKCESDLENRLTSVTDGSQERGGRLDSSA